jgi:predicted dehydrogenase
MATWDIYTGDLAVQAAGDPAPRRQNFGTIGSVLERAYFDEINTFVDAIFGNAIWPHSQADAQMSSATLAAAERSCATGRWAPVDPEADPETAPPAPAP